MSILSLLAVVTIGSTMFATQKMRLIDDTYGDLLDGPSKSNLAIARANRNLVFINRTIFRMLIEDTPAGIKAAQAELTETEGFFGRQIGVAVKSMPSQAADIQHVLASYKTIMAGACAETLKLAAEDSASAQQQAIISMKTKCDPALNKLMEETAALTNKVNKFSDKVSDDALEVTNTTIRDTFIIVSVGLLLVAAVALALSRFFISNPIRNITASLEELGRGNLDTPINETKRRDEIGLIVRAALLFRHALTQIQHASEERAHQRALAEAEKRAQLQLAADNIERETQHVAQRSSQTSAKLAARAEVMVASAARVLASTASVIEASSTALERSEAVAAAGEQLSHSAQRIATEIDRSVTEITSAARAGGEAQAIINQLSASVQEIGSIAQLIGGIAERTNMLALNATIEAARAGEAGKGFAVVANEVKALAQETGRSTSAISQNATAIQQATLNAVKTIGDMVERITAIERITHSVAKATDEQATATGEIARNVTGSSDAMRVVTQQIDLMIEEAHGTDASATEVRDVAVTVGDDIAEMRQVMVRIIRG